MKILAVNGMGNFPVIQNQLMAPLGITDYKAVAWNEAVPSTMWDIIIGHSLGGHRAIQLATAWKPKALLVCDPRWMDNLSWLDVGVPWRKPFPNPGVDGMYVFDFIHSPNVFFPGYQIVGAVNTYVISTHMTICGHPAVTAKLQELIKGISA